MGWKGTLRSMNAAANRWERDARRRQKQLEREQREVEKMEELEQAAYEVELFENYIDRIQTIHTEHSENINWSEIVSQSEPKEPQKSNEAEALAKGKLDKFKPSLLQKIFGGEQKARQKLEQEVQDGKQFDVDAYTRASQEYTKDCVEWKREVELAQRVLNGEQEAYAEALQELGGFSEIAEIGSKMDVNISKEGAVRINLYVHGKDIIPEDKKSLLKSGKLSKKNMPKGEYYELFQDYVCSAAIRTALEVFAVLPIEETEVCAIDNMLNSATGHLEDQPILSALFVRKTLATLNLTLIDPSDALSNFVHNMDFKRTKGFSAVERINWHNPDTAN